VAAALVCLVVAGSLLGNSFVAGRMTVAAANKKWIPHFFASIGHFGAKSNSSTHSSDSSDSLESDAPINALVLSTVLAALYILFGNFRALLTFNGLGEYSFFFLAVLGVIVLRFREPNLHRPYKPFVLIPAIFAVVSGFVLVRGAAFAPVQAVILVIVWAVGLVFYRTRRTWTREADV
jgi:L-type amino acid transporter 9